LGGWRRGRGRERVRSVRKACSKSGLHEALTKDPISPSNKFQILIR
jgi:hypothetical protein